MQCCYKRKFLIPLFCYSVIPYSTFYNFPKRDILLNFKTSSQRSWIHVHHNKCWSYSHYTQFPCSSSSSSSGGSQFSGANANKMYGCMVWESQYPVCIHDILLYDYLLLTASLCYVAICFRAVYIIVTIDNH